MAELHENAIDILYGYDDTKMEYFHDLPDDTRDLMNTLWEELKIENEKGYAIYIICAVILAAAIVVVVITVVKTKKKARSY